ncbi:MAG: hypothetical protein ACI9XO_002548 [Paraglaciecola sp.]
MAKHFFWFLTNSVDFIVYKQGGTENKDNDLQEVRLDDKVSNSDIVRLPVSADRPADIVKILKIQLEELTAISTKIRRDSCKVKRILLSTIQVKRHSLLQL